MYDLLCGDLSVRGDLSAPAEPNARFVLKCGLDGNFKPAGARLCIFLGNSDSIRDYDELSNSGPLRSPDWPSLNERARATPSTSLTPAFRRLMSSACKSGHYDWCAPMPTIRQTRFECDVTARQDRVSGARYGGHSARRTGRFPDGRDRCCGDSVRMLGQCDGNPSIACCFDHSAGKSML